MHAKMILGFAALALLAHTGLAAKAKVRQADRPIPPCPEGWLEHPNKPEKCQPTPPCPTGWRESKKNSEICQREQQQKAPLPPCPEGWTQSKRNPEKCRKVKDNEE